MKCGLVIAIRNSLGIVAQIMITHTTLPYSHGENLNHYYLFLNNSCHTRKDNKC